MVEGRTLYFKKYAIHVIGNDEFHSLGLRSLRKVRNGGVSITASRNLCYGTQVPFGKLFDVRDLYIKDNMNSTQCGEFHLSFWWLNLIVFYCGRFEINM